MPITLDGETGITTPDITIADVALGIEQGMWTPSYDGSVSSFDTINYGRRVGRYLKIGSFVLVSGYLYTNSVNVSGASGVLRITGFPYTAVTQGGTELGDRPDGLGLAIGRLSNFNQGDEKDTTRMRMVGGQTYAVICVNDARSSSESFFGVGHLTTGSGNRNILGFSGVYIAA